MPTKDSFRVSKLAVQTKIYPLYEVIHGEYKLSRKISKPKPVKEYFQLQGRFKHMSEAQIQVLQEEVDSTYSKLEQLASGSMK